MNRLTASAHATGTSTITVFDFSLMSERHDRSASDAQPPCSAADPDPFQEIAFPSAVAAKRAIADFLGVPLAKLAADEMVKLDAALARSLRRADVIDYARTHLKPLFRG